MNAQQQTSYNRYKIACEFCGGLIDVRQDNVCPNCGAAFHASKNYAEFIRQQEARKQHQVEAQKKASKPLALGTFIGPILIFLFILLIIYSFLFILSNFAGLDLPFSLSLPKKVQAEVSFQETAEAKKISVVCDKMEEYHHYRDILAEGKYYVKLHLIITNKTDKTILVSQRNSISCTYTQDGYVFSAKSIDGFFGEYGENFYVSPIPAHTSVDGWVYFEVGKGADLTLNYDNTVIIHIPYENLGTQ